MTRGEPGNGKAEKSLQDKLGFKPGMTFRIIHPPPSYFSWLNHVLPATDQQPSPPFDFVHLFTNSLPELQDQLATVKHLISPDGMIWVSHYKRTSGESSEITENLIRETALPLGLVDVKVCSVSEDWSGLKLVVRRKFR
jgi:hypothetical protein